MTLAVHSRGTTRLPPSSPVRLALVSVVSLLSFGALAVAVAHGQGPYGFERPVAAWLGAPGTTRFWNDVAEALALPVGIVVLVTAVVIGLAWRTPFRVICFSAFAFMTLVLSNDVFKSLVDRHYYGEPTFPSGNVTAVAAIVVAVWLALYPGLAKPGRIGMFLLGVVWIALMSAAVVGALWHTPVDALGSLLLSIGVVCAGAAVYEYVASAVTLSRR